MKIAVRILQFAVRILALVLIVLGIMFWTGRALELVPLHMRLGQALIACLWILAAIGLRAGVKAGLVFGAIIYGLLTFLFAVNMHAFLPGGAHQIIRVAHLLIGLGAVGFAESIAARIKRHIG
jgi:hypothetical protein